MIDHLLSALEDFCKKYGYFVLFGALGALVMRMRKRMNWKRFAASAVISLFVSFCIGIVCEDLLMIKQERIIYVLCGLSGIFGNTILDEVEEIIKNYSNRINNKIKNHENH